jgi:hypothetical protein
MCSPTLAVTALAAVGKASEISATNQAAEASQEAAVQQQLAMNSQRVQEAEMENKKTGLALTQKRREALRAQASTRAAAAGSGVAGGSPLRNLINVHMQESMEAGSIVSLNESRIATIGKQSEADFLKTRSAINVAESKKSTGLSAALQIGVAAGTAYYGAQAGATGGASAAGTPVSTFNTYGTSATGSTTGGWLYGQKPMSGFSI